MPDRKSREDYKSDYMILPSLFDEPKVRQNEVDNIEAFTQDGHMTLRAVFDKKATFSTIVESKFLESELPCSANGHQNLSGDGSVPPESRIVQLGWYFKSTAKSYQETLVVVPDEEGPDVALGIDVVIGGDSEYFRLRPRNGDGHGGNGKPCGRIAVLGLGKLSKKEREEQRKRKEEREKEIEEQKRQQEEKDKERERKENREASDKGGSKE